MSHNPLALATIGVLAPSSSGERVPVTALKASVKDNRITAALVNGQLSASVASRTPIEAAATVKRLLVKVENGQS